MTIPSVAYQVSLVCHPDELYCLHSKLTLKYILFVKYFLCLQFVRLIREKGKGYRSSSNAHKMALQQKVFELKQTDSGYEDEKDYSNDDALEILGKYALNCPHLISSCWDFV